MSKIRTRFAPSPTGELHIGGARTALFAYLFAKSQKGDFLIRIEDTDRDRYVEGSVERILDSLKWLGIEADEKIMYQSKRLSIYKKAAEKLVKDGHAYYCFCSKERLDKLRARQSAQGLPPRYDGKCRELSADEIKKNLADKKSHVIRIKIPRATDDSRGSDYSIGKGKCEFNDLIRGKVTFLYREVDDAILLKSDGYPTYHLANVVDDNELKISHVLRSEEWLSSTPKHLLLYQYFGWKAPEFAHLSMILGQDKAKLSKRHGATSILQYRDDGYLPEAMINFMVLLGWNPGDDKEIFSMEQVLSKFKIKDINKSPAIFDPEKLDFFNGYYLREKSDAEIVKMILALKPEYKKIKNLSQIVNLEKTRMKKLGDIDGLIKVFSKKPIFQKQLLIFAKSDRDKTKKGLSAALKALTEMKADNWKSIHDLDEVLANVVKKSKLGNGDVFWPVRASLSGLDRSPSPGELLWALGKKESLKRLKSGLEKLS